MIITISGKPGSGKSTVAKIVAEKLGLKHYSVGGFMRQMARQKGMTLLQLGRIAEKERWVDRKLDEMQLKLRRKDTFVIDSRLGYHFLPNSFKVFLDVKTEEAAKRIYNGKKRAGEKNQTLKQTEVNIRRRISSEKQRYKKYYNLNPYNMKNYELMIDTTEKKPEQIARTIIRKLKKQRTTTSQ